jgi:hypothetical protein
VLSPGSSVDQTGAITVGTAAIPTAVSFAVGSTIKIEVASAGSSATTSTGGSSPAAPHSAHDVVRVVGSSDLTGSSLILTSLGLLGQTGFDSSLPYSWRVMTTTGQLTGLPELGAINGADFAAVTPSIGTFTLTNTGQDLYVNYAPVPEPVFVLPVAVAGLILIRSRVRRARSSAERIRSERAP